MIGYKTNSTAEETKDITIHKREGGAIVSTPSTVFSFSVEDIDPREIAGQQQYTPESFTWAMSMVYMNDIELIPYGVRNNMPQLLRDTVYNNPNIPGIMEKKQQLLWGQGPQLYTEKLFRVTKIIIFESNSQRITVYANSLSCCFVSRR